MSHTAILGFGTASGCTNAKTIHRIILAMNSTMHNTSNTTVKIGFRLSSSTPQCADTAPVKAHNYEKRMHNEHKSCECIQNRVLQNIIDNDNNEENQQANSTTCGSINATIVNQNDHEVQLSSYSKPTSI